MTTDTSNHSNPHQTTKEDLNRIRDEAKRSHLGSQKDAGRAAGSLAVLWIKTASPYADSVGRDWRKNELATHTVRINSHNKGLKKKSDHWVPIPEDDEHAQNIRIAFDADTRELQPMVSRYSCVVKGLVEDHPDYALMTADEFANYIAKQGGFEAYLQQKRGNEGKQPVLEAAVRKSLEEGLSERVESAKPKATLPLNLPKIDDGTVILIGRHKQGQLDVCAVVPVDDSAHPPMLRPFSHHFAEAPEPSALFIHNTMQLAGLVKEGEATELRAGGMQSGSWLKVDQVATLEGGAAGPVMSVTVRHADASVIVKARAKASVGLTAPPAPLMLMPDDHARLRKRHAVPLAVFCNTVTEALTADGMCWSVRNRALNDSKEATVEATWIDPSGQDHKPLTIRDFDDAMSADLSRAALRDLRERGALEHAKTGNEKSPTRVNLEWDGQNLGFSVLKGQSVVPLNTPAQRKGSRSFKLGVVQAAVDKALKAGAAAFTLAIDPAGLLRLSWEDEVAAYEVFIPASTSTGGLITSKQTPLV
jgi:hypothetical protein